MRAITIPAGLTTLFASLMFTAQSGAEEITSLKPFLGKHRIIIADQDDSKRWVKAFRKEDLQLTLRNVIWLVIDSDRQQLIDSNSHHTLSDELVMKLSFSPYLAPPKTRVVLIGKDGDIKETYDELDIDAIYDDIDAMPMRKREMYQENQREMPQEKLKQ